MRRLCAGLLALSVFACSSSPTGLAGTYRAKQGSREIILRGDGSFRMLNGERTSPSDIVGSYEKVGDTIVFTTKSQEGATQGSNPPLEPAKITEYGFEVGQERYTKT
jgi:hypothetical protein